MAAPAPASPARLGAALLRLRTTLALAAGLLLVVTSFTGPRWLNWIALALFGVALALLFWPRAVPAAGRREPVGVLAPVTGRWVAVNSPASRTPSHGTHAYGQTYAIDLVHRPGAGEGYGGPRSWPLARPPGRYPGFGQPVRALMDRPGVLLGAGLPFAFTGTGLAGAGVPRNGEALLAAT